MTVGQLIEKLKDMDQDAEVFVPAEPSADGGPFRHVPGRISSCGLRGVEKAGEPTPCWTCLPAGCSRRALPAAGRDEWNRMIELDAAREPPNFLPADGVVPA